MRVLSKSRFKLGLECPNKLFYTGKKEYANSKKEDTFLLALAEGGFQVEELARMHFPGGHLLEGNDGDYQLLWQETQKLLSNENVIIYEAAFLTDGLFARTDILIKKGNQIQLIEVKSKSYDPNDENIFIGKKGGMMAPWKPYLYDIAFQKFVMSSCFPEWKIESFIMMADKSKKASIDGLNQMFRISKVAGNRTGIIKTINTLQQAGDSILGKVAITDIVTDIIDGKYPYHPNLNFIEAIHKFKESYIENQYYNWHTSYTSCKSCEFKTESLQSEGEIRSGFEECFVKQHQWGENEFKRPKTFDVWSFLKGKELFNDGVIFMDQLNQDNIGYKEEPNRLSNSHRQWLQITKEISDDKSFFFDKDGLVNEMATWVFPLHFIDFETSATALPFNKDRSPYEQTAFQFSHHIYFEDSRIEHYSEYINTEQGSFPNFEFLRQLKVALENDKGSIFRYSHHENTILNAIYVQLQNSNENDKEELCEFIKNVSHAKSSSAEKWRGERDMIDLWEVLKKYYYNPLTKGSNSIKAVLPAILNTCDFLKEKYSKKLADINITSRNFPSDHIWLELDGDSFINPYKRLPKLFSDWTDEEIEETLSEIEDIADGGAALTAYSKLQYTNMPEKEILELRSGLLKYCELDTLAMVMLYEHFKQLITN
jgi:Domain of unknown function(DUF2779)